MLRLQTGANVVVFSPLVEVADTAECIPYGFCLREMSTVSFTNKQDLS